MSGFIRTSLVFSATSCYDLQLSAEPDELVVVTSFDLVAATVRRTAAEFVKDILTIRKFLRVWGGDRRIISRILAGRKHTAFILNHIVRKDSADSAIATVS